MWLNKHVNSISRISPLPVCFPVFYKEGVYDFESELLIAVIIVNFTKETIYSMESKLNREALTEYSREFADKVSSSYFEKKDYISGVDILKLCELNQINLFVIYRILRIWTGELAKLKSLYFDYESSEVRDALHDFMNTLSRHIRVNKVDFIPFLIEAVCDTVLLVVSPYHFYLGVVHTEADAPVKLVNMKTLLKYVKINKAILEAFIIKLENAHLGEVKANDALAYLNEVFENISQSPEDIEGYIEVFSRVSKLRMEMIFDNADTEIVTQEEPEMAHKGTYEINEDLKTLNDQFSKVQRRPGIADIHKNKKIESIKSHLSINQKFMFINQLFDGSVDDFNTVVDFLDNCDSQVEAMNFINNNYLKKNNWNKDLNEVKEFIEVVAKKYA